MFDEGESREEERERAAEEEKGHPVADTEPPGTGPGAANAEATPTIGDEGQEKEQTSHPAPPEDVGTGPEEDTGS